MDSLRNQRTIADRTLVEGVGYWSGRDVSVEFRPGEVDSGIVFVRRDLPGQPRIPACIACRCDTPRRTSLRAGGATVEMIEHIMAALAGLRVDNCEVWVDAEEMPGCDGSAQPFVEALDWAGVAGQAAARPRRVVRQVIRVGGQESWIEARPPTARGATLEYHLDYGSRSPIARQSFELALSPESFRQSLASCRTFLLQEEAEQLVARGLCRRASARDLLVFGPHGPLENQLRFPDECVRHKLVDMVGDLGLAGCDLVGQFVAYRSGHKHNAELVEALDRRAALRAGWRRCA
jgi:UDP-3-O-acyl N-acetylglucosamine deacetylase